MEVYEQQTSWPLVLQNSKTIVLWGSDMVKNQQANWWCPDHDVYQYYEQLKRRLPAALSRSSASTRSSPPRTIIWGAIRSNISPLTRRRMSRYNWRWHIPCTARNCTIKISSITIASVLTSSSPICWAKKMDSPKMPHGRKNCAVLTPTPSARWRGRWRATERKSSLAGACNVCSMANSGHGWSSCWRQCWARLVYRAAALVLAGTITAPGRGRKGIILSGFSGSTTVPPVHDSTDYKGYSSTIPIARFMDAILEPGKIINWNGKSVKLPPLKMCVFAGTNPFHRHQQINRIIEGWRKLETVIAIDNQWTSTCRFADIVLPATTNLSVTTSISSATTLTAALSP